MIYEFARCFGPQGVCDLIEELEKTYKKVEIISITASRSFWVFYKIGSKK